MAVVERGCVGSDETRIVSYCKNCSPSNKDSTDPKLLIEIAAPSL